MWQKITDKRWEWTADQERHLLLHAGGRMVEFHDSTIHVYAAPEQVDPVWPLGGGDSTGPAAVWQSTDARPDLADASDDAVWAAMAGYGEEG